MPQEPEPNEEQLAELTESYEIACDDLALNDRVYKAVETALGRIAREHYPGLGNWEPENLRELANRISQHASRFALDLANLSP
jgi:hypothetical protein